MTSSASSRKLCGAIFDVPRKRQQLLKIEEQISAPDFWNNSEATQTVMQERKRLESAIADEKHVSTLVSDVDTLFELGREGENVLTELNAEIEKLRRSFADRIPRPPLSVLIDHIDHIAKVAGIDHVGLGSDFDGVGGQLPEGIDSAADLPKITEALMARDYSAEDCRKILGGNLLRVFREVEQISKQLQTEERPRITEKQPFDEWKK